MSTEHVVVPVETCRLLSAPNNTDCVWVHPLDRCQGCRNDGTRARLDQAVPVERCWPDSAQMWVEVES